MALDNFDASIGTEQYFYELGFREGCTMSGARSVSEYHNIQSKYFQGYHDGLREYGRVEKLSKKLNLTLPETMRLATLNLFKQEFGENANIDILPEHIKN